MIKKLGIKIFIVLIILAAIVIVSYFLFYKKLNIQQQPDIDQQLQQAIANRDAQIYIYSAITDSLYMKDINQNYYNAGTGSQCPALAKSAIEIQPLYVTYNCANIPEKYKNLPYCSEFPGDATKFVSILIKSAQDVELGIIQNIKGNYTPPITSCFINTPSNSGGDSGDPTLNPLPAIKNFFINLGDYLRDKIEQNYPALVKAAASLGGLLLASMISEYLAEFFIFFMILPLIMSGQESQIIQAASFGGVMGSQYIIGKLSQYLKTINITTTETSIIEAEIETSTDIVIGYSVVAAQAAMKCLGYIMWITNILMIAGMFVDAFDPCDLASGNISQQSLDDVKQGFIKSYSSSLGTLAYPSIWDASYICSYNLNSNYYWNNCMSDEEKSKTTQEAYLKADNDLLSKYTNEYLSALKVNSLGQDISNGFSNKELQNMLQGIAPNIDWSPIANMNSQNIADGFNAVSASGKLDLLLAGGNEIEAAYISNNWYIFAICFIIIALLLVTIT